MIKSNNTTDLPNNIADASDSQAWYFQSGHLIHMRIDFPDCIRLWQTPPVSPEGPPDRQEGIRLPTLQILKIVICLMESGVQSVM